MWKMIAHHHGQVLNLSQLGSSLGISHTTVRSYVDLLSRTFIVRVLPPFLANTAKRLVKSPRIYLRDSGMLLALLDIETWDDLLGHPVFGHAWEGMVIEHVLRRAAEGAQPHFYRTAAGKYTKIPNMEPGQMDPTAVFDWLEVKEEERADALQVLTEITLMAPQDIDKLDNISFADFLADTRYQKRCMAIS